MLKTKRKFRSAIALFMMAILCANITLPASATPIVQTEDNTGEKYYLDLNSNTMERDTILLHEYDEAIYIIINDLCSLTRSTSTFENDVFTVTQGFWSVSFDYVQQQFSDGWQTIDTRLINTGTYYLVPAIEFLTYFGANVQIDKENNTFFCLMPECTAWEALAIDYENTLVDIYDLYGGEGNVNFSLTLDILMDFILNGTPNSDDYLLDAYNESLSINLCDYDSIKNYQKNRDESLYDYLISDEGQDAADFATTLLDTSISGVEYLCETYYNTLNLKFADLVKSSYQSGMLDESTHYASQILNGYRKNKAISNLAETSKIPLTQVAPVFIQTALESAQQLKYATATNNLAYNVMGSENTNYLGLNVDDNDWFRIADTYKNKATIVSNNFVNNAVDSFADMGWDQLIGDCVQSFTGTSALLFTFSKECATSFVKWFPLTSSSVQAFESDRLALYLSELQQNVANVIASIDFNNDYENEEKYQKYIEANLLYCRVSIAMYENLITMVGEFGNDREYWKSLFQERIDALAVSMYKLTLFQDDGASACIPIDLLSTNWNQYSKGNAADIFKQLPQGFDFTSGAGAWGTHFDLNSDGTFIGQYHDSDMGDTGNGYSNGTVYICDFEGKFSTPKQVNEYIYTMNLEYLKTEGTPGNEYYEDDTRYIYSDPYGFDDADEFLIYLPGCPLKETTDEFISWSFINSEIRETIPADVYGIYNISGMEGFIGIAENNLWSKEYTYNYDTYRSALWPSYYSMSHLVFWPETGAATLDLAFKWTHDNQTKFEASDSNGTGDYDISLDFNEDYSSVSVSVKSLSGYNLMPWGGNQDGTLTADYKIQQ